MDKSLEQRVFEKIGWEWKWVVIECDHIWNDGYQSFGMAWILGDEILTRPHRVWNIKEGTYNTSKEPDESDKIDPLPDNLPLISSQWKVCAKYLVPFMREKDLIVGISNGNFYWEKRIDHGGMIETRMIGSAEIKDDNIAKAACLAFMEVEL